MNEMNETHILSLSDPHPDNYTDIVYHIPSGYALGCFHRRSAAASEAQAGDFLRWSWGVLLSFGLEGLVGFG
jgi:hypothetical protein